MKNRISDVRDHLVAQMEALGDKDADAMTVARAKAVAGLADAYTKTVAVEIRARELLGEPKDLPDALQKPALLGSVRNG